MLTGTTQVHDLEHAVVHPETRQGRRMELREATYFYGRDAGWFGRDAVVECLAPCSRELFLKLEEIVTEWDAPAAV